MIIKGKEQVMNRNMNAKERELFEARLDLLTATYVTIGLTMASAREAALADLLLFNPRHELSMAA